MHIYIYIYIFVCVCVCVSVFLEKQYQILIYIYIYIYIYYSVKKVKCSISKIVFGLIRFGWILWHINHCRLFNAKSILYRQTIVFQTIQFSISNLISSIQVIDRTLSGATAPGQSGPVSDGNKVVLHIPQRPSITGTSPQDCLVLYPRHLLGGLIPLQRSSRCIL